MTAEGKILEAIYLIEDMEDENSENTKRRVRCDHKFSGNKTALIVVDDIVECGICGLTISMSEVSKMIQV